MSHEPGDLLLHEVAVNVDQHVRIYDVRTPIEDTLFDGQEGDELRGALYRYGLREHGRCTGKMYVDTRVRTNDEGGERWEARHIGYVFVKRRRYDDVDETYLCETWLSLERVIEPAHPTTVASVTL